ncbi:hypothetical protein D3C86_1631850 [compost metagenome]
MRLDVFQVAAQYMQRVAQRRELHIALLAGTGGNIGGLIEHFLSEQLGAGQLDQIERAADLMKTFHRLLQQAAVMPLGNEMLEARFGLRHGGEQFVTHQTE